MSKYGIGVSVLLLLSISLNIVQYSASQPPLTPNTKANSNERLQLSGESSRDTVNHQRDLTTTLTDDARPITLEQARSELNRGNVAVVERFLRDALRIAPNDPKLLLLEADWIFATEPLSIAIIHFYDLLDADILEHDEQQILSHRITSLINNTVETLFHANDWDLLAQFLEPLYQRYSSDVSYTLTLAQAYAQQQKFTLMEDTLASLPDDHTGAIALRNQFLATEQAPDAEAQSQAHAPRSGVEVALERYGDQYLIDTQFMSEPATLLIDTGASSTAISFAFYQRLKRHYSIEELGLFDVQTAGGLIRAPLVKITQLQLGPYPMRNIGVLVMPENAMSNADGLLGMNVLKQFEFHINQSEAVLILQPQ